MQYVYDFLGYDIERQLMLLLYSLLLGTFLGAVFDFFRFTRAVISYRGEGRHTSTAFDTGLVILAFIEDVAFALIWALTLVLFCFAANNGSSRAYILFGALVGFVIYLLTVGRLTRMLSRALAKLFYRFLAFIKKRIVLPAVHLIYKTLQKIYTKTIGCALNILVRRIHIFRMKKMSRELTCAIARLYINKRKENEDETISPANAGEARNIRSIHNNDRHPRHSSDRVQSA